MAATSDIRIIGGMFKRRKISFVDAQGLRPTPDRVRETLFNWLMWDIAGKHVVDLCAGSGVLGLECWSRGAASVAWVEPNKRQCNQLQHSISSLATDPQAQHLSQQLQVINHTAQQAFSQLSAQLNPIDVLFIDPPYSLNIWSELACLYAPLLAANARIYVEANIPHTQLKLPPQWVITKQLKAGQIYAALYGLV